MYQSFQTNGLETEICVEAYLTELQAILFLSPQPHEAIAQEYREMILESFERGLQSKPLICFRWDDYLGHSLQDIRAFLEIPRRRLFRVGSHYLEADLY